MRKFLLAAALVLLPQLALGQTQVQICQPQTDPASCQRVDTNHPLTVTQSKTVSVTSNLTTGSTYGSSKAIGANGAGQNAVWVFPQAVPTGHGRVVRINLAVQGATSGTANFSTTPTFSFNLFNSTPTASTFTDAAATNFNYADAGKFVQGVNLVPNQQGGLTAGLSGSVGSPYYIANLPAAGSGWDVTSIDGNLYAVLVSTNTMSPAYDSVGQILLTLTTEYWQ